jgi:hypothetical protein
MMAKMPAPARLAYRVAGERVSRRTTARLRREAVKPWSQRQPRSRVSPGWATLTGPG